MKANSSTRFTLLKPILLLIAAVLLLSACNTCPEPEQQPPDGTYTTTVTVADLVNIGMPRDFVCENAGTFAMTVTGNKWSMFQTAVSGCTVKEPSWNGTWKICGDEAVFTPDGGGSYTYGWTFDGTSLRFTRVEDDVPHRIVMMITYPWVLQMSGPGTE